MALTAAPTVGGLAGTASARAAQETQAVVAGLKAQQDAALAQAAHRAAQQGQLATAAGNWLTGQDLGGKTATDYANAAAAQTAAASGFSGGLQQTVSDAAAQVQANLAAGGSPQTALNQGQAAGNALFSLGGYLPSAQLGVVGPSVAASMRTLPAMTLGYGQQLAAAALGTGQQAAAALNPDIAAALARQPALAASYLDALRDRARQAEQDRIANAHWSAEMRRRQVEFAAQQRESAAARAAAAREANQPRIGGSPSTGIYRIDPRTGKFTWISKPPPSAAGSPKYHFGENGEILELLPNGKIAVRRAATPDAPKPAAAQRMSTVSDATGTYVWNPYTGQRGQKIAGPSASASSGQSYQDAYGRQIKVNADGTQTALSEGTFTNRNTGQQFRVTTQGKFVPLTKAKPPKTPKPKGPRPLTTTQRQEYTALINSSANGLRIGGVDDDGNPHKPMNYREAFLHFASQGYFATPELASIAKAALRSAFGDQIDAAMPSGPK